MSAGFASLSANDIGADGACFRDVFGVADHVHVQDVVGVEAIDDLFGWDADGGDEEFGARGDYYGDEFVECWVLLESGVEGGRGEGGSEVGVW